MKKPIESHFPTAEVSLIAQRESWRKEVFRPIYHIHKWWANRLGSVFRAIALGAIADEDQNTWANFYCEHDFSEKVVLDPFMGSGTSLGEAAKLGARVIGCDINPISTFAVRQALTAVNIDDLERTFEQIEDDVHEEIAQYYRTLDPETGAEIPALYYFWVTMVQTPQGESIPLFRTYVFSKNAYPRKKPQAQIVCPHCWQIIEGRYDLKDLDCIHCGKNFNPQHGPANGRYVIDSAGNRFEIKKLLPSSRKPFQHKLYAIMAINHRGEKIYLSPSQFDFDLLAEVDRRLQESSFPLPTMPIRDGHNTNQVREYNYNQWRDFFNNRQLLCLGILLQSILEIKTMPLREQFLCLFSTALEYNNMFCTFKGEGTGAVRPLFSHHILKPERTPLENNVWGTPKSSGSFSRLFRSKLIKAKKYLERPTEIKLYKSSDNTKAEQCVASKSINLRVVDNWEKFAGDTGTALVLNGDSAALPIPDEVVDAVITDPPYFDFIHYSELSDFFFAWLAPLLSSDYSYFDRPSSYQFGEVQHRNPTKFAASLARVFTEARRVMKSDGVMVFSFHHSRPEGWQAIYQALSHSGFCVTAAYPVYAEMAVASPKSNTRTPISVDIVLVCKKSGGSKGNSGLGASEYAQQLEAVGITLSRSDHFNVCAGLFMVRAFAEQLDNLQVETGLEKLLLELNE